MKPYVLAYAMDPALPLFTREDLNRLTHINLAFGLVRDGVLDLSGLTHLELLPKFRDWNPEIRIVLSVGGWGAGGFSTMAMTEEGRRRFALSCREAVDRLHLDGIDIDWEYPCNDQAGIDCSPRDRENFTFLLRELRSQLGGKLLSIAAGAGEYFIRDTEMDRVARIVDYVQLMTYDMRSGFSHQAGHHAALYAGKGDHSGLNTDAMVKLFHSAGVPLEKMVIGAAFYSRHWTGVPDCDHGLLQEAESVGNGGPRYSDLTEDFLREKGFTRYWDEEARAAYLWNGSEFLSYESPEAIRQKCLYVREKGLLGIMYWEHSCDATRELLTAMDCALREGD